MKTFFRKHIRLNCCPNNCLCLTHTHTASLRSFFLQFQYFQIIDSCRIRTSFMLRTSSFEWFVAYQARLFSSQAQFSSNILNSWLFKNSFSLICSVFGPASSFLSSFWPSIRWSIYRILLGLNCALVENQDIVTSLWAPRAFVSYPNF